MSTRANIILKEGEDQLFFYRHSDGYPSETMPSLNKFVQWMKDGKIRNNINQGSGWLILLGAMEYNTIPDYKTEEIEYFKGHKKVITDCDSIQEPQDWKVGAYEPTTDLHGDIEYLYTIDLITFEIKAQHARCNYKTGKYTFSDVLKTELA